jgi:hypothetical protein
MRKRTVFSALLLVAFSVFGVAAKASSFASEEEYGYYMRNYYKANPDRAIQLCSIAREKNRLGITTQDMAPALAEGLRQRSGRIYPTTNVQANLLHWLTINFCPDVR